MLSTAQENAGDGRTIICRKKKESCLSAPDLHLIVVIAERAYSSLQKAMTEEVFFALVNVRNDGGDILTITEQARG